MQLLGYLFLFAAVLAAVYLFVPAGQPVDRLSPRLMRHSKPRPQRAIDSSEWLERADAHEHHSRGHAERVATLASALAAAAGLPPDVGDRVHQAALYHDLGLLDVSTDLISKRDRLSQREFSQVWHHSVKGAARVLELTRDAEMATWVRWAHERWDGLGYPDALAGQDIPLPARILRLADSAESMLQERPYRPAMVPDEVAHELNRLAGIVYDPSLVPLFLNLVLPNYLFRTAGGARSPQAF